jgi:prepilin-type N-terminal cleavage/methylation domain-containing protein
MELSMSTRAHPAASVKSRKNRRGFTLVELLVVIGIIAVLIAILLPSLNRARGAANLLACESNIRQFGVATHLYVNENRQTLPSPNWKWLIVSGSISFTNAPVGWAYQYDLPQPGSPEYTQWTPPNGQLTDFVQTGVLWHYLKSTKIYHCPTHTMGDTGGSAGISITADTFFSYVMNGAIDGFGAFADGSTSSGVPKDGVYLKITQFKSDDILMWEGDENSLTANTDGASYPHESYNPANAVKGWKSRHNGQFSVLSMDGHVEAMRPGDWWPIAQATLPADAATNLRTRLWCSPLTTNGHSRVGQGP